MSGPLLKSRPTTIPLTNRAYWTGTGLSRPSFTRVAATSRGVAVFPTYISAGSDPAAFGIKKKIAKVTIETITNRIAETTRRRRIKLIIAAIPSGQERRAGRHRRG